MLPLSGMYKTLGNNGINYLSMFLFLSSSCVCSLRLWISWLLVWLALGLFVWKGTQVRCHWDGCGHPQKKMSKSPIKLETYPLTHGKSYPSSKILKILNRAAWTSSSFCRHPPVHVRRLGAKFCSRSQPQNPSKTSVLASSASCMLQHVSNELKASLIQTIKSCFYASGKQKLQTLKLNILASNKETEIEI